MQIAVALLVSLIQIFLASNTSYKLRYTDGLKDMDPDQVLHLQFARQNEA